jgi:serine protease Do
MPISRPALLSVLHVLVLALATSATPVPVLAAERSEVDLERIFFDGGEPRSLAELQAMERHQQELAQDLVACTVGIVVGAAHGSGVIISEDGYVLTAAHVGGVPNRAARFILPDGRQVRGKTLGLYRTLDAGLMKIESPGPWPFAEMAAADDPIKTGQWCVVTGHPGGFQEGRAPVVRIGRVLLTDRFAITTDCTLVGGDSGGPLFDMNGKVIGINSRIGRLLTANMHVPINAYQETWDRLVKSEEWGHFPGTGPFIGVRGATDATNARLSEIYPGTPAEQAGLKIGDVIVKYDGRPVTDFASLQLLVNDSRPGDKIQIEVLRGDRELTLELVVGQQRSPSGF